MNSLSIEAKLIGVAVAILAVLGMVCMTVHDLEAAGAAKAEAAGAAARSQAQAAAAAQIAVNQATAAARVASIQEAASAAETQASAARADRDSALAADARLRQRLAAASGGSAAAGHPAAAASSAAAASTSTVPWGVFDRLDDAAGQLAAYADDLAVALGACVSSYRALTP